MNKKYQIFISSTYEDLKDARAMVQNAITSMEHFPAGMEYFSASPYSQWEVIKKTIDSSDYYVLILAKRYGTVIKSGEDAGISYTEREFRYAVEKQIPVIVFIKSDDAKYKESDIDFENMDKLSTFRDLAKKERIVEWWKDENELVQKVTTALYKQFLDNPRPGWIRSDGTSIEELQRKITKLKEDNNRLKDDIEAKQRRLERLPKLIVRLEAAEQADKSKEDPFYDRVNTVQIDTTTGAVHLQTGAIDTSNIERRFLPAIREDFTAFELQYLTDDDFDKYNNNLPTRNEIDTYIEEYRDYHMIVDHGIPLRIIVENEGTEKATELHISLTFPKEIPVYDLYDVKRLKAPHMPQMPQDLHRVAQLKSDLNSGKPYLRQRGNVIPDFSNYGSSSLIRPLPLSEDIIVNVTDRSTVNITSMRGVTQAMYSWFDDFYIVPLQKGEFKVLIWMICNEWPEPVEDELTIFCE